ncbi:MAG: hypothetical protein J5860_02480 [Clostridia bacterium]|nr:hypothetical protein [Clostridia bacterium]
MSKREYVGLKTFASMLTIVLVFAAVCGASILLLVKAGVMNVDWMNETSEEQQSSRSTINADDGIFGTYSEIGFDEDGMAAVLTDLPFCDGYFIQSYLAYFGEYDNPEVGGSLTMAAYDIYKSGDKYKIITYDSMLKVIGKTICNGKSVYVYDEASGKDAVYPLSDELSFEAVSPVPDFSAFATGNYKITGFTLSDDKSEYTVKCYLSDTGRSDEIHIKADTGIINHFMSSKGDAVVYDYSIGEFVTDYSFSKTEFDLPKAK